MLTLTRMQRLDMWVWSHQGHFRVVAWWVLLFLCAWDFYDNHFTTRHVPTIAMVAPKPCIGDAVQAMREAAMTPYERARIQAARRALGLESGEITK